MLTCPRPLASALIMNELAVMLAICMCRYDDVNILFASAVTTSSIIYFVELAGTFTVFDALIAHP